MKIGSVGSCWRYPVKSLQGLQVDTVTIGASGVEGDRGRALIDTGTGHVLSAKRVGALLEATADDAAVRLPDGSVVELGDPSLDEVLSAWLGLDVTLAAPEQSDPRSYEMTFDPPDDDAEYYEIPMPAGSFVDLAPLHVLASATLDGCRAARPDLEWDVRRFRPNLVLDVEGDTFVEDSWSERLLRLGDDCVLRVDQPTVRCAMPLRAQPGLVRQPELFAAMNELHTAMPNHLGAYAAVVEPGRVRVGDAVELVDP